MTRRFPSMISPVAMTALLLRSWPQLSIFDGDGCGRLHSWMDGCCSMTVHRGASTTVPSVGELRGPLPRCALALRERAEDHLQNLSTTVGAP